MCVCVYNVNIILQYVNLGQALCESLLTRFDLTQRLKSVFL